LMNFLFLRVTRYIEYPCTLLTYHFFFLLYNVYSCMNHVFNSLWIAIACSLLGLKIGPTVYFCLGLCCSQEGRIVVLGFFIQGIFTVQQSVNWYITL
jgi:hypothetical protein